MCQQLVVGSPSHAPASQPASQTFILHTGTEIAGTDRKEPEDNLRELPKTIILHPCREIGHVRFFHQPSNLENDMFVELVVTGSKGMDSRERGIV